MLSIIAIVISGLAFTVSLLTLWRAHLAPFQVIAVAGPITMRVHSIENDGNKWYIPHFATTVGFTNAGAQIGRILGVRVKVCYASLPIDGAYEIFQCNGEFNPSLYTKHSHGRFEMIDEAKVNSMLPFTVLPRATVTKFYLFDTRWDKPVRQESLTVEIQILTDRRQKWLTVQSYEFPNNGPSWTHLYQGGRCSVYPYLEGQMHEKIPADLHKYTFDSELDTTDSLSSTPSLDVTPGNTRQSEW